MSVVIDLAIIAVIVLCAVRHYKLGLFCSVLNVGKFFAAAILAGILRIPLSLLALRLIYGEAEAGAVQSALAGMIAYVVVFAAVVSCGAESVLVFAEQDAAKSRQSKQTSIQQSFFIVILLILFTLKWLYYNTFWKSVP